VGVSLSEFYRYLRKVNISVSVPDDYPMKSADLQAVCARKKTAAPWRNQDAARKEEGECNSDYRNDILKTSLLPI